jgi:hypothetical protein
MKTELLEDLYKQKLAELFDSEKQLLQFCLEWAKRAATRSYVRLDVPSDACSPPAVEISICAF